MKVFRNLFIYVDQDQSSSFIEALGKRLNDGWTRDTDTEKKSRELGDTEFYYFTCTAKGERSAALLAIARQDKDTMYVANIVPREQSELSYDQYNFILEEYYHSFVQQAAEGIGCKSEITSAEENIENWVSEDSVKKLKLFSNAANKSTASSHPSDQQRWFDFLVQVHPEHSKLSAPQLARWFIEVENWPEDIAHKLTGEYEFAMELLDFRAGRRQ